MLNFQPVPKFENEIRENSAFKYSSIKDVLELEPIKEESETEVQLPNYPRSAEKISLWRDSDQIEVKMTARAKSQSAVKRRKKYTHSLKYKAGLIRAKMTVLQKKINLSYFQPIDMSFRTSMVELILPQRNIGKR